MHEDERLESSQERRSVRELDGTDVCEPGCYLHIASGLLTRIYPGDLSVDRFCRTLRDAGRMARLASDPDVPVRLLRRQASRYGYWVNF